MLVGQSLFTLAAVGFWEMFPIGFSQTSVTLRNQHNDGFKCKKSYKRAEEGNKKEMWAEGSREKYRKKSSQSRSKGDRKEVGDRVRELNRNNKRESASKTYSTFPGEA